MSCTPAVMPSTVAYVVRRLDSVEQEVILPKKALGSECLDRVCKSLGILEKEYFSFRYVDKNGETLWLNLRNPLHEQLAPAPGHRPILEMRVKYFIRPQKILQTVTRLHFYKQLKKDLILGKLNVNTAAKAARLTALIAQIDKGEYRSGMQYQKVTCPSDSTNLDARTRREHQRLAGTSVEVAIEKFLNEGAAMELYGTELYHVIDAYRVPRIIGVGPEGVRVYSSSMEVLSKYTYSAVQYTAFRAKKFNALVKSNNGVTTEHLEYELRSRSGSQALYRTVTEFHTFFQRDTVSRVVKNAGYCKSLLGNFKGHNPDRFYFDVTRTHREVVDRVWSILHPTSNPDCTSECSSPTGSISPAQERRVANRPLPPLPVPRPSAHMQRSQSMREEARPNMFPSRHRMPPLPPYSQRSNSADGIGLHLPHSGMLPMHMQSMSSFDPYLSPSISETDSDDQSLYSGGGSDTYMTMVSPQREYRYIPSTRSDPGTSMRSSSAQSDTYINSESSECSAASFDHQRMNSPPPVYTEVDPEHAVPLNFTEAPNSAGAVIPLNPLFNFDAAGVLARTRELEGELQRLRSAMTCRLCKMNPIGATFCPCGHTVCCYQCAKRLRSCWECNETVHSIQRMILA